MDNKQKVLLISGSPRNGNTNFVLSEIYKSIKTDYKELIFLKDKDVKLCKGCLACHFKPKCSIKDDMSAILPKMINSDIFIIGTPNYFDNVSGLMKNFMDRCHPFYKESLIRNKKVILIFVGGGKNKGTKKYLNLSFFGFVKYLKLNLLGSYGFQALDPHDLSQKDITKDIYKIIKKINSL
jgi:multimeric flavodoxin WrbA